MLSQLRAPLSQNPNQTSRPRLHIAMSVTTTDNPMSSALHDTLQDYEIHMTGDNRNIDTGLNISETSAVIGNPHYWPRDRHRIPNYRPINRNLNLAERPRGSNGVEQVFLAVMFNGVALNAVCQLELSRCGARLANLNLNFRG
ncbi:hypothetical protein B0O99DRAFT_623735 [Bisporella sp. PMI_857]|nr:hypothetical protein B0O99DRAFT_623735 [Bisporella sp. PMI_857]